MARGTPAAVALDMSKFFDTNYHFMVPELDLALVEGAVPDFSYFLERVGGPFQSESLFQLSYPMWYMWGCLCTLLVAFLIWSLELRELGSVVRYAFLPH